MNITEIKVPAYVRYISQWQDFKLPEYPHIMDKQIPGCGFTEYCIRNDQNVILVCPRKTLLQNKKDQHGSEVHYAKSNLEELGVDADLLQKNKNKKVRSGEMTEEKIKEILDRERDLFVSGIESYCLVRRALGKACKILVTYDSFRKVKEVLTNLNIFDEFQIVVDEFQSIFIDSRFKADTELEFVTVLQGIPKVCYVSATPMLEEYLDKIPEFKDLPYFKLDWKSENPLRVIKPKLKIRSLTTVAAVAKKIISEYRSGDYITTAIISEEDGSAKIVESKEAVIYVNSVNNIVSIIGRCKLAPEEVNILCARTKNNQEKLTKSLGQEYQIGNIPLLGEPRKMFTLCTRTVYLGADFYSDNARTFIISDANVESMAVDISLDLPQILGRQRLKDNPWKNEATIYIDVKNQDDEVASPEDFKRMIDAKIDRTRTFLEAYNNFDNEQDKSNLIDGYQVIVDVDYYRLSYLSLNKHAGKQVVPMFNNLAMVAEQRAFDIQQIDYADHFSVFSKISEIGTVDNRDKILADIEKRFNEAENFYQKMKVLCEEDLSDSYLRELVLESIPNPFKKYYIVLGPDMLKRLSYNNSLIKKEYDNASLKIKDSNFTNTLKDKILNQFIVGEKYDLAYIKLELSNIYKEVGLQKKAKASDIQEWIEVKKTQFRTNGKVVNGFELLKIK